MIRLLLISLLGLLSLLTVCKAPTYHLWMTAIAVDEFPWLFIALTGILLLSGIWIPRYQWAGTIVGLVALMLFLTPVIQAYSVASNLPHNLNAAFGSLSPATPAPGGSASAEPDSLPAGAPFHLPAGAAFQWTKMLTGMGAPKIPYNTYTYVRYGDTALTLDFYPAQPAAPAPRPCILIIHGGSWSGGDAEQLPELNSVLAFRGYNVAAINYRLAPRYRNPAPVDDVSAALAYLRLHAGTLDIDTNRFVLLGRSAGAQIALLAAYTLAPETTGKGIKGVISYYGPADMVWGYSIPTSPLIMNSRKVMSDYLGGPYEKVPANYAASSPIEFVSAHSVPTLLIHGKNDVLVAYEHSTRLSKKLRQYNIPHFLLTLPWATHGCDYTLNGPAGQLSAYGVETFLQYVIAK